MMRLPTLPPNLKAPCEELSALTGIDAESNYNWAIDTVEKYNRCAIAKEALTRLYIDIVK